MTKYSKLRENWYAFNVDLDKNKATLSCSSDKKIKIKIGHGM